VLVLRRVARDYCACDGSCRRAHDPIGVEAVLVDDLKRATQVRAECVSAAQDESSIAPVGIPRFGLRRAFTQQAPPSAGQPRTALRA
jgi:hypothetical protein